MAAPSIHPVAYSISPVEGSGTVSPRICSERTALRTRPSDTQEENCWRPTHGPGAGGLSGGTVHARALQNSTRPKGVAEVKMTPLWHKIADERDLGAFVTGAQAVGFLLHNTHRATTASAYDEKPALPPLAAHHGLCYTGPLPLWGRLTSKGRGRDTAREACRDARREVTHTCGCQHIDDEGMTGAQCAKRSSPGNQPAMLSPTNHVTGGAGKRHITWLFWKRALESRLKCWHFTSANGRPPGLWPPRNHRGTPPALYTSRCLVQHCLGRGPSGSS